MKRRIIPLVLAGSAALCLPGCMQPGMGRGGPPQNDMSIDAATRREVVDAMVGQLDRYYVYPDKAKLIGASLKAQLQHGDFDSVTSAEKFADVLTDSMQKQTGDRHLGVHYFEKPVPELAAGETVDDAEKAADEAHDRRLNFGFAGVQRLHGNIGYLDLHAFDRLENTTDRMAAAMTLLQDTGCLIIDLRKDGGGDPDTVMMFASYLFDKPTHLNDIYWREGDRIEARWTQAQVPGKRYGEARKIYVLTSSDTFSAAEDFAYAMKYSGRATVIGETTGGGAHPGDPRRLDAHFMMFVPNGRAINPVTHTDWEGVGVEPDIKTSAKKALDVAQIQALKVMIAAETDPQWKERLQSSLEDLE